MAEEQRCDQSSGPIFCADNCGFYGNPATLNLCSKCYRRRELKTLLKTTKHAKPAISSPISADFVEDVSLAKVTIEKAGGESTTTSCGPIRCGACKKRVGLMEFKCKCGSTYCVAHRYPEKHSCSFDFKLAGKEAIANANPVIRAAKLDNKI